MFRNPSTDALVVLLIVLLIFGPKRLPALGKQLGQGIREFKDSITGNDDKDDSDHQAIAQSSAPPPTTATTPPPAQTAPAPTGTTSDRQSTEVGSERRS